MGSRAATSHWFDYFSVTCFTPNLIVAERHRGGITQRLKERFSVPVRTACGKPWRIWLNRLHPRLSSSAGRNFLCGDYLHALPPANLADLRATFCQNLPSHDEDQRRRIALRSGEHLCRNRIG